MGGVPRPMRWDGMGWERMGDGGRACGCRLGMPHLFVFSTHCPPLHRFSSSWLDPSAKDVSQLSCTVVSHSSCRCRCCRWYWCCYLVVLQMVMPPAMDDDFDRPRQRNKV
ncbi:uncharacterized protein LY79DRAFT_548912 [Colletotrichum navitas]|uniref:Uncharacterized protein n=1 Tax=Colletotrichum navitas TaxID=681940 RepID=A0AAD8Q2Y1_9PEZI|nr:uncharacterized protein LY79DRAFT_548912 [Colletotrichum navitas]KAK1594520.1 hypothetical protein LY79DRAFT_548912 [Colletotrichum navitas]